MIRPGAEWLDTDGKPIQAHGGSFLGADEVVLEPDEHVAAGAAAQAARAVAGGATPGWTPVSAVPYRGTAGPHVRDRHRAAAVHLAPENW